MSQLPQGGMAQSMMGGGPQFQAPVIGQGAATGAAIGGAIGGVLPWGAGGAGLFGGDLAGSYAASYNDALKMNHANYSNILKGYQDTAAAQNTAQGVIGKGPYDLYNNVFGGIPWS